MAEVSNRVLAALLIVAIVVSLGGTMISLSKIKQLSYPVLSGLATGDLEKYGLVNITVESVAALYIADTRDTIDFGTGHVNITDFSGNNCTMYINGSYGNEDYYNDTKDYGCAGDWADTWKSKAHVIVVENVGSTYLNVSLQSNETASDFLESVSSGVEGFYLWAQDNETGSCADTPESGIWQDWWSVTTSKIELCDCLNQSAKSTSKNSIAIGAKVVIPGDFVASKRSSEQKVRINITAVDKGDTC